MAVYESDQRDGRRSVLKKWMPAMLVFLAALLAGRLFPQVCFLNETSWYTMLAIFTIKALVEMAFDTRINKIIIAVKSRKLLISNYDLINGNLSEVYSFEQVRIQFDESKNGELRRIYAKTGKHGNYTISEKDGFFCLYPD